MAVDIADVFICQMDFWFGPPFVLQHLISCVIEDCIMSIAIVLMIFPFLYLNTYICHTEVFR